MNDFTTDPCPACKPNTVCRTPSCGRLKSKQQEPFIQKKQAEPVAWAETDEHGEIAWGEEGCFSNDPAWIENPIPLYTHPAPAVAQEPVARRTLGYGQGIEDAAKMLDTKADEYAKEFGFDDMGALEFSREAQRDYHSTLIELAEEVRSMEATNSTPTVAQPPAEVVRELVEALKLAKEEMVMAGFLTVPEIEAALTKAKEHGL